MQGRLEFVDTNVLLRLARRDVPAQADSAEAYLRGAPGRGFELAVTTTTVSEFAFVLGGAMLGYSRQEVAGALQALLELPFRFQDLPVIALAVDLYRDHHPDWDDCLLAAYAIERADGRVVSFDRGLDRIPGLSRQAPAS